MNDRIVNPRTTTPLLASVVVALFAAAALIAMVSLFIGGCGDDAGSARPSSTVAVTHSTGPPATATGGGGSAGTTDTGDTSVDTPEMTTGPKDTPVVTDSDVAGARSWRTSATRLEDLAAALAQQLPSGQAVQLPEQLPAGWGLAAPDQEFGDIVAGYFQGLTTNPSVLGLPGEDASFTEYMVVFTDGKDLVGQLVVMGDWGETPFEQVTANGKTLMVYEDESLVAILASDWEPGTVVATPGGREAALEIAASIKSW